MVRGTGLLRRFVYLVMDGKDPCALNLHRIDMSRFFSPRSHLPAAAAPVTDCRLPRASMTFYAPSSEEDCGSMHFMLVDRDKVLATDQTGRAAIYDAGLHAVRTAPALTTPKDRPVSVAVGGDNKSLYILDSTCRAAGGPPENSFEALVYERGHGSRRCPDLDALWYDDWRCHPLPAPPYTPGEISAYAVVGGSDLLVSPKNDQGTYLYDAARRVWAKHGDWTLPFGGLAEYVPEYNLWFGLSSKNDSDRLCAFDLAKRGKSSPPVRRNIRDDFRAPKDWVPVTSFLVHLGSARFCIARFFSICRTDPPHYVEDGPYCFETLAVFTAVEVVPSGTGKGLCMIKHQSKCYNLGEENLSQWVL